MFRLQLLDHLQGVVLRASAITTFSACLRLFIWYVAVCCLCVCVPDVPVCGMFGCEVHNQTSHRQVHQASQLHNQTSHRQVRQARTHIDNIQPHTK